MRQLQDSAEMLLVIAIGLVLVWQRSDNRGRLARIVTTLVSGAFAYVTGPEIAAWAETPENLTLIACTVLGPVLLETAAALAASPERLAVVLRKWRGGK